MKIGGPRTPHNLVLSQFGLVFPTSSYCVWLVVIFDELDFSSNMVQVCLYFLMGISNHWQTLDIGTSYWYMRILYTKSLYHWGGQREKEEKEVLKAHSNILFAQFKSLKNPQVFATRQGDSKKFQVKSGVFKNRLAPVKGGNKMKKE